MGYKGTGDGTKIHFAGKHQHKAICGVIPYRHTTNWSIVNCKKCLSHFDRLYPNKKVTV